MIASVISGAMLQRGIYPCDSYAWVIVNISTCCASLTTSKAEASGIDPMWMAHTEIPTRHALNMSDHDWLLVMLLFRHAV